MRDVNLLRLHYIHLLTLIYFSDNCFCCFLLQNKAGRLLIRKAICDSLRISYADVQLGRTDKGKPYLQNALDRDSKVPGFDFNISHQGDYVLLAAESSYHVGVDLMNIDRPGSYRMINGIAVFFCTSFVIAAPSSRDWLRQSFKVNLLISSETPKNLPLCQ